MSNTNRDPIAKMCSKISCNKKNPAKHLADYNHFNSSSVQVQLSAKMRYANSVRNGGGRIFECGNQNITTQLNLPCASSISKSSSPPSSLSTQNSCNLLQTYGKTNTKSPSLGKFLCI